MRIHDRAFQLEMQCRELADLTPSRDVCRVIIQMDASQDVETYIKVSASIMERRAGLISAKQLIPNPRTKGKNNVSSKTKTSTSWHTDRAVRAQLKPAQLAYLSTTRDQVEHFGKERVSQVLNSSDFVKEIHAKRKYQPEVFWSSSSMTMELTRDELVALPTRMPMVSGVYPNRDVRLPPVSRSTDMRPAINDYRGYTWGLSKTGALACWGAYDAEGAVNGQPVLVAVLDTGIDPTHPDFVDEIGASKIAGFAEFDEEGRMLHSGIEHAQDDNDHGTHCAGTIVGGKASGRYIGMAPQAKILAGRVLQGGSGTDAQILAGIDWAIKSGAHIISMSLGGLQMTAGVLDTYTRAIINANSVGIPVVVAVGNEGSQTTGAPGNDYFAFTVGATDHLDRAAGFSGGRTQIVEQSRYINQKSLPLVYSKPDVSAPGVDIFSAVRSRKWEAFNGSSMATPHVAGAMALLLSGRSTILQDTRGAERAELLQNLLISSVTELGEAGQNHRFGYGRIDTLRAFGYADELGYVTDPAPRPQPTTSSVPPRKRAVKKKAPKKKAVKKKTARKTTKKSTKKKGSSRE